MSSAFGKLWAGQAYGTNTGKLFVSLKSSSSGELNGKLHFNDDGGAVVVYLVEGSFHDGNLVLEGAAQNDNRDLIVGILKIKGHLDASGNVKGSWESTSGTAGTFILFPHDQSQERGSEGSSEQLHAARYEFHAVELDKNQIIELAEEIQRDFSRGRVIITFIAGTEQSRFLSDFRVFSPVAQRASVLKLFVQEPDGNGLNRTALVEFGPQANVVVVQGRSEAWVLGIREKYKNSIKRYERRYPVNTKILGVTIGQAIFIAGIAFVPSLPDFKYRIFLLAMIVILNGATDWLQRSKIPFAILYLTQKPQGAIARLGPPMFSWGIQVSAGIAATLLAAYLQGYFSK